MVQIKAFTCAGATNATAAYPIAFDLPTGYNGNVAVTGGVNTTDGMVVPFSWEAINWCNETEQIGKKRAMMTNQVTLCGKPTDCCSTALVSGAYVSGSLLVLGIDTVTPGFLPSQFIVGPIYGFTIVYDTTTDTKVYVNAATRPGLMLSALTGAAALLVS